MAKTGMTKKTKTLISVIVILVIVAVTLIAVSVSTGKNAEMKHGDNKGNKESVQESTRGEGFTFAEEETAAVEEETNYWDNVTVYEEQQPEAGETKTDENGEVVTEEYPGADSGWSPIVPADEVNQNGN